MAQKMITSFYPNRKRNVLTSESSNKKQTSVFENSKGIFCDSVPHIYQTPKRKLSDSGVCVISGKRKKREVFVEEVSAVNKANSKHSRQLNFFGDATKESKLLQGNKINAVTDIKSKVLKSEKLTELKGLIEKFESKTSKYKTSISNNSTSNASTSRLQRNSQKDLSQEVSSTPAYERFHNLKSSILPALALPYKYKCLTEAFHCCDLVVSMLHNRQEICSFEKVKNAVQDMMSRTFDLKILGKIKAVFPLAYYLTQEKLYSFGKHLNKGGSKFQLVLAPNFGDAGSVHQQESGRMPSKFTEKDGRSNLKKSFSIMTPNVLLQRRKMFLSNLLDITKNHHEDFLTKLNPPMHVPKEELTRWHPKFSLDEVPDILPADLPEQPDVPKYSTAQDVLERIRGTASNRLEMALQNVVASKLSPVPESTLESKSSEKEKPKNLGALKGICSSLLEKIRKKETNQTLNEMTRSPAKQKRFDMISHLPEMIRILRNYFVTKRKTIAQLEEIGEKIAESYHSAITPVNVNDHLELAAEILPDWLSIVKVPKGTFIKMDMKTDISQVNKRLQSIIEREKKC